ncbi:MAG TPA: MFS transporter [Gaiellaceae bacterium]|jgi:EmrB/QacA subfamily drug resistance transporter|nr:MFS transporter [Gaiellaceae bacterium]
MAEVDPLRWKALAVVCAAFFMTVLDVSIVNVALPSIGKALDFSRDSLQWVITAYAITFGGFLLLGGRAADLLGRRRVFLSGVVLFTAASFLCGLAWSEGVLITARAVQGLGAAIISPAALSIVTTTFEEGAERNKALGIWGAIGGSGAAVGVLAGGVLTKYLGWEWIFFVNVPVGALALALAPRLVRESRADREASQDIAGAVTVTAGLALLVYAVSKAPDHGWGSGWTLSRLAVAVVLLAAFLVVESRAKDPIMPFRIFRVSTVAGANAAGLLLGAVVFANFFLLTLYVQQVLGWSALKTGLTFVATAGTAVLWAGIAQALVTRIGAKTVMAVGFVAMIAGMAWYTQIPVHASYWSDLLPGYLLVGFALPFSFIPVSIAALAGVQAHEAGLASGLINTAQQIGGAIGVAVTSSVSISHFNTLLREHGPQSFPQSFTSGSQWAFWVCAGVAVVGLVATLTLVRSSQLAHAGEAAALG